MAAADTVAKRANERHREGAAGGAGTGAFASGAAASGDALRNEIFGPGFRLDANGSKLPKGEAPGRFEKIGPNVGRFDGRGSGFDGSDG
jgi:hypothetical protein